MGRGGRNSSRGRGGGGGDGFNKSSRGRGGGGGYGRGRGRGGIGAAVLSGNDYLQSLGMGDFTPFSSGFNTNAQTQSPVANRGGPARGGGRGGRGRGRGRGGVHSVQSQHAVGFDYSSLAPRSIVRQSNENELENDSDEDDEEDIVIETRKGYVHKIKPHLENDQRTPPDTPQIVHGYETLSDSENVASSSRVSPSPAEKARAERIRTGQIAAVIPTGPKSLTPFRVNNAKVNNQLPADLPVFKPATSSKKSKKEYVRPIEDPLEDACMGGIPRGMRKRQSRFDKGESSLRRFEGEKRNPPSFVKANGEWKDGQWIRTSEDGPESLMKDSNNTEKAAVSDNVTRTGLGFNAASTSQPKVEGRELDVEDDAINGLMETDSTVEELLKAFPGSAILQESGTVDDSLGYYSAPSDLGLGKKVAPPQPIVDIPDAHMADTKKVSSAIEEANDDDEEDDDVEIILVDQKPSTISEPKAFQETESTVEMATAVPDSLEDDDDDGFFVDTVGEETKPSNEIQYESITTIAVGEAIPEQDSVTNASTSEDEDWKSEGEGEDFVKVDGQGQPGRKGKKARNAAKKARRKARKNGFTMTEEPPIAREGDSDLDWGSDGPPVRFRKTDDQIEYEDGGAELSLDQLRLHAASSAPQNAEEEETQLAIALAESMGTKGKANDTNKALFRSQKDAILEDYMANAMGGNDSDSDEIEREERDDTKEDQETELDAMLRFMKGMDGQRSGKEITIDDINVERQLQDEEEWMTDSDAESGEESEDSEAERVFNQDEKRLANESESSDVSSDESDSSEDDDDDDDDDEDDSDDDDDLAFERNFTWADADEDFIARLDKFAQANDEVLKGRNRGARNKLYRAIERGDFSMLDEDDMLNSGMDGMDLDDPVLSMQPAKRGKNAKKTWKDDDLWAQELQSQWQKDRAKKADNKRKRAEQRALEADNPFHNTNGKGKGTNKKQKKKAARAARRAERVEGRGNMKDIDMVDELFGGRGFASSRREDPLSRHAVTLIEVNRQIELFMYDVSKTTLSLAPMDKRARAQVHQLASCYNLISKSKGSGNHRFPTLIKNSRSGLQVKQGRVNAILRSVGGASFGKGSRTGANAPKDIGRKTKERIPLPRNQEGAQVGFGAERIGQDNVGHRLLSAMGWVEGMGVGATQGMSDPVGATIKISRGGLGF